MKRMTEKEIDHLFGLKKFWIHNEKIDPPIVFRSKNIKLAARQWAKQKYGRFASIKWINKRHFIALVSTDSSIMPSEAWFIGELETH
jgi:hypothetical protein